jgi:hypothetical protein
MAQKRYKLRIFFKGSGQIFEDFSNKREISKYKSIIDHTVSLAYVTDSVTEEIEYWKEYND